MFLKRNITKLMKIFKYIQMWFISKWKFKSQTTNKLAKAMENKSLPMSVRRYAGKIVERRENGVAVREDEIASISGLT